MSESFSGWALLLVVIWPLLLTVGVVFAGTRPLALRGVSWATLPALMTAGLHADSEFRLPSILLGSGLVLDDMGRGFLLMNATLWLAVGWLFRPRLSDAAPDRCAVLLLLAMAGGIGMSLAGDALLFFTATTLAGYALCGLLLCNMEVAARHAGRVLLVLLVVSDLVVFELLLILAQEAGSVDFLLLRDAFANTEQHALLLVLLVVGFGIKVGVAGLHFWVAPVFVTAGTAVRPAVVGFMLGAGLLGWLRLTPLGEVQWLAAGGVLQWLAWITLGYAVIAGMLQTQVLSILAYAAVALSAFLVALLGWALLYPQVWIDMAGAVLFASIQSGLALAALLLLERRPAVSDPAWLHHLSLGATWMSAWLLAAAPISVGKALADIDGTAASQMMWVVTAIAFLAVRSQLWPSVFCRNAHDQRPSITVAQQATQMPTVATMAAASGLTAGALLAAMFNLVEISPAEFWLSTLVMAVAAVAAWLSVGRFMPHLPALPSGDLLAPISEGLSAVYGRGRHLGERQMSLWRDAGLAVLRHLWSGANWWRMFERVESRLNRWELVLVVLLLLGLTLAWQGAFG
jgi:NADH:ubiquinone oxidoreductase subunit 2 (subunit N)